MKLLASFALLVFLAGCAATQTGTTNALTTKSGKANITLQEDGTVRIKGVKIEIDSSEDLILKGKPLHMN